MMKMKETTGLVIGLMFASALVPLAEPQEQDVTIEWDFWREKINPETQEGIRSSAYAFTDIMNDVIWVKNTGTVPITRIEVKFVTVTKGQKVKNVPNFFVERMSSDCPRERFWEVDLQSGEEKKFEEAKIFTEWTKEDLAYQGMHPKRWDPENATVVGDLKRKVVRLKDVEIDFSQAELYTIAELFANGQSFGKKTFYFNIVKPS